LGAWICSRLRAHVLGPTGVGALLMSRAWHEVGSAAVWRQPLERLRGGTENVAANCRLGPPALKLATMQMEGSKVVCSDSPRNFGDRITHRIRVRKPQWVTPCQRIGIHHFIFEGLREVYYSVSTLKGWPFPAFSMCPSVHHT